MQPLEVLRPGGSNSVGDCSQHDRLTHVNTPPCTIHTVHGLQSMLSYAIPSVTSVIQHSTPHVPLTDTCLIHHPTIRLTHVDVACKSVASSLVALIKQWLALSASPLCGQQQGDGSGWHGEQTQGPPEHTGYLCCQWHCTDRETEQTSSKQTCMTQGRYLCQNKREK